MEYWKNGMVGEANIKLYALFVLDYRGGVM